MIIVQLLGGLGNQMFQYAFGFVISKKYNKDLYLDTSILLNWSPNKHPVNRDFDLDIFILNPRISERKHIRMFHTDGESLLKKLFFKIYYLFNDGLKVDEELYVSRQLGIKQNQAVYFSGTWQSEIYFKEFESEIRNQFKFKFPICEKAKTWEDHIKNSISVCLNVRRTDYVNIKSTMEVMANVEMDYYQRALDILQDKLGKFEVFVFSDDIGWCMDNLKLKQYKLNFITSEYAGYKYSTYMQLMINCKHFIIPNSTFAWWAAWLSNGTDKLVIVPTKWYKNNAKASEELIPQQWIRI